jgi:hypothetical protein
VTASDLIEDAPLHFLRDETQGVCCLVPLTVLDRPVALLLAAGADSTENGGDVLSLLAELTVLRLENIALRILYQLTSEKSARGLQQEESPEAAAPAIEPEPSPAVMEEAAPAPTEPAPVPVPAFETGSDSTPPPAAEETVVLEQAPVIESFDQAEPAEPLREPEPAKVIEMHPFPEEEKLHSDAKRFARLLVSEIKLYNEHHVVEGRENRDLYLRLKRDIDRSREMYEKRVSPNVARKIDYFHDEIIRILGDNDPSTLGSDYPGPRVES